MQAAETQQVDLDTVRAKYQAERDKRVRADGNEQYKEVTGDFAYFVDDPERLKRLDLNEADSTALVTVRGIGPWSAHAIMKERARWGYFVTVSQLRKIRSLDARWLKEWDSVFYVVPRAPALFLNSSSFAELNEFYGFRFHQVKRIVFYRERFGPVLWSELTSWEEFSDVDTTFLRHYVSE